MTAHPLRAAHRLLLQRCMGHFRHFLVPMDGSPPSQAALAQAVALAEDLGSATVEVLYVKAPDEFEVGSMMEAAPSALREAERAIDEAVADATRRIGDRLKRRTEKGDPNIKILEVAAEEGPDLIVMGTHGRVGRLQSLVGSVANAVVRNSPCPVLTVRHGQEESFKERIRGRPTIADQAGHSR